MFKRATIAFTTALGLVVGSPASAKDQVYNFGDSVTVKQCKGTAVNRRFFSDYVEVEPLSKKLKDKFICCDREIKMRVRDGDTVKVIRGIGSCERRGEQGQGSKGGTKGGESPSGGCQGGCGTNGGSQTGGSDSGTGNGRDSHLIIDNIPGVPDIKVVMMKDYNTVGKTSKSAAPVLQIA